MQKFYLNIGGKLENWEKIMKFQKKKSDKRWENCYEILH